MVDASPGEASPCACVVAWGAYGNELTWEDEDLLAQALELKQMRDDEAADDVDEDELEELLAATHDIEVLSNDDGAGHGHASGAVFIFARRKKAASVRKSQAPRTKKLASERASSRKAKEPVGKKARGSQGRRTNSRA